MFDFATHIALTVLDVVLRENSTTTCDDIIFM